MKIKLQLFLYSLFGILSLLMPIDVAGESSWPEFRGPTGQGWSLARGLPMEWSNTENVAWKIPVPGKGWSSPIVHNNRIYATTAVAASDGEDSDQSLRTLCLDARTGNTVWDVEIFLQDGKTAPAIQSKNSHASPTPVVHGNLLYVHFGHQGTACLSLNGDVVWRTRRIQYPPRHGNGGSPVIVDNLLVFSCDGESDPFVVALDRTTGKERWRTSRNIKAVRSFSFSTPLLIHVTGKPLLIIPGSELVGAYEPRTGQEIWRVRYAGGYSVVPRPVYGQGLVYVCSGYGKPTLYAIRPDGHGDVTDTHVAWQTDRGTPHNPSLLLTGDELHMVSDSGVASCLDAKTGAVHWIKRLGGKFSASPLFAEGVIYFQNETGTAYVVEASKKYHLLATNSFGDDFNERTFASYAVDDGALFIRSEHHLFRIEQRN